MLTFCPRSKLNEDDISRIVLIYICKFSIPRNIIKEDVPLHRNDDGVDFRKEARGQRGFPQKKQDLDEGDPQRLAGSIALVPPPPTAELAAEKKSRFDPSS